MQLEDINKGLGALLNVASPWQITTVDVQHQNKVVDIFIGYARGSEFGCPLCGKLSKVHDSRSHRIRHLNWFEYRSYLNVKVPRVKCPEHGTRVISSLPWGHTGSHYSFFLKR
jgi:transposase